MNLFSIQSQLRLEVLKGLVISINHNMAVGQITGPIAAGLDNGKNLIAMHGIVMLRIV